MKTFIFTVEEANHFANTYVNKMERLDYLTSIDGSLQSWLASYHSFSRYEDIKEDPLKIKYGIDKNLKFNAYTELHDKYSVSINLSRGIYLSLQDLSLRAISSENFYNPFRSDNEYPLKWPGSSCIVTSPTFHPKNRYFDYSTKCFDPDSHLEDTWYKLGLQFKGENEVPWIGQYVKKLPEDNNRLVLASGIMNIALTWICLHEEEHFRQGHLQYLTDNDAEYTTEMSIAFEFQADKSAAQGIADIFFRKNIQDSLPQYAQGDWLWLLRFLMTSVGMAILIIDIGRRIQGNSSHHPRPRTRLLTVFRHITYYVGKAVGFEQFNADSSYGNCDREGVWTRQQWALSGALSDLTEVQMILDREDPVPDADPLWPLSDAFPYMASPPIFWNSTTAIDIPAIQNQLDESARKMALLAQFDYKISSQEAMEYYNIAGEWTNELNKLIDMSNSNFRDFTKKYREWEV